jgi:glucose/arabinose dehydrogenase
MRTVPRMRSNTSRVLLPWILAPCALLASADGGSAYSSTSQAIACDPSNGGITLPQGFCATIWADALPGPRHLVALPNGDVLVNARGIRGPQGEASPGGIFLLRDSDRDDKAETRHKLADISGTHVAYANGYIYASGRDVIVRFQYRPGSTDRLGAPDTIVAGLPTQGHSAHNFVVDGNRLFVNVGSRSNACQQADRQRQSPGVDPCVELQELAGIWLFEANRTGQTVSGARRFATGIRNALALTRHPSGRLFSVVHGRDQLFDNWQPMFTERDNAETPAEEFIQISDNDDFGWPYCYFDTGLRKRVTAPEYGGDGKRSDRCSSFKEPLFGYPAHWGPNDVLFYTGSQFPSAYRNGAFIAFHGSWNRAPLPQAGFNVVFQPMTRDGRLAGEYSVFASGFVTDEQRAAARVQQGKRPTGLAVSPDGSLFVADDLGGTIFKIQYRGVGK